MDMSLSKLQETLKDRETYRVAVQGDCKESDTTERQNSNDERVVIGSISPLNVISKFIFIYIY